MRRTRIDEEGRESKVGRGGGFRGRKCNIARGKKDKTKLI